MNQPNLAQTPEPPLSVAFQQLASFVAIDRTSDFTVLLRRLIQQVLAVLPGDSFTEAGEIAAAAHVLFGMTLRLADVEHSVHGLLERGALTRLPGGQLSLPSSTRAEVTRRIEEASHLREEVKADWLAQAAARWPGIDSETLWRALEHYLGRAFRLHGMNAVAALLPETRPEEGEPGRLGSILDESVSGGFKQPDRARARDAICSFIATVRIDRKRAEYIAQLADGAFNYFALMVAPEVSEQLRSKLSPLTLFLDTNFLFGVLGLQAFHSESSDDMLSVIRKFSLPFRLRYHEATERELTNTLFYYRQLLAKQRWPQQISRAAIASRALSNIELRYHKQNAVAPIDAEDYFAPYEHWDVLLSDKKVAVYRVTQSQECLRERAQLEGEYSDFLDRIGRRKAEEAIQHDMALLQAARSLRSQARSTLDAGALLLTWDYQLCLFDWKTSRERGMRRCVVPPSILWQVVRPFVSEDQHFDRGFAETFALPEFAISRGEAARAASKLLSILAGFNNIPEETATRMLTNDLLLTKLQQKETQQELAELVESALADENAALVEEKASLARENQARAEVVRDQQQELDQAAASLREQSQVLERQADVLRERETEIRRFQESEEAFNARVRASVERELEARRREEESARQLRDMMRDTAAVRHRAEVALKIAGVMVATVLIAALELAIEYVPAMSWLRTHPRRYGVQICLSVMVFGAVVGWSAPKWRKVAWSSFGISALLVLAQIIDVIGAAGRR